MTDKSEDAVVCAAGLGVCWKVFAGGVRQIKNALTLLKTSFYFIRDGYAHTFQLARNPWQGLKSLCKE
jgi:hypothetical protein